MKILYFLMGSQTDGKEIAVDEGRFRDTLERHREYQLFLGIDGKTVVTNRKRVRPGGAPRPRTPPKLTEAEGHALLRIMRSPEPMLPTAACDVGFLDLTPERGVRPDLDVRQRLKGRTLDKILTAEARIEKARAAVDRKLGVGLWESFELGLTDPATRQRYFRFVPGSASVSAGFKPTKITWCAVWSEIDDLPTYAGETSGGVKLENYPVFLNILDCVINHRSRELIVLANVNVGVGEDRTGTIDQLAVMLSDTQPTRPPLRPPLPYNFFAVDSPRSDPRYEVLGVSPLRLPLRGARIQAIQWATFVFDLSSSWAQIAASNRVWPMKVMILQVTAGGQEPVYCCVEVRHLHDAS